MYIYIQLYEYIAVWLVNYEQPRTQSEYEESYTFKMFFFQCINFYSSLIYIAFFKVDTMLEIKNIMFMIVNHEYFV